VLDATQIKSNIAAGRKKLQGGQNISDDDIVRQTLSVPENDPVWRKKNCIVLFSP